MSNMGMNLIGPKDETPIQALRRLAKLRSSFVYKGMGYYEGGPSGEGCDSDDMDDINSELACAAIVALPSIERLVEALREAREDLANFARDEHSYDRVQSSHGSANLSEMHDKMDAVLAEFA